jgi:hypothetical protein
MSVDILNGHHPCLNVIAVAIPEGVIELHPAGHDYFAFTQAVFRRRSYVTTNGRTQIRRAVEAYASNGRHVTRVRT